MKVPIKKYLFGLMDFTKYSFLNWTSRILDASEAALKKECVPKYVKQNKYFFKKLAFGIPSSLPYLRLREYTDGEEKLFLYFHLLWQSNLIMFNQIWVAFYSTFISLFASLMSAEAIIVNLFAGPKKYLSFFSASVWITWYHNLVSGLMTPHQY